MDEVLARLEALLVNDKGGTFGMVPGAPWDSLLMLGTEHWTFDLRLAWYHGCYFGPASAAAQAQAQVQEDMDD